MESIAVTPDLKRKYGIQPIASDAQVTKEAEKVIDQMYRCARLEIMSSFEEKSAFLLNYLKENIGALNAVTSKLKEGVIICCMSKKIDFKPDVNYFDDRNNFVCIDDIKQTLTELGFTETESDFRLKISGKLAELRIAKTELESFFSEGVDLFNKETQEGILLQTNPFESEDVSDAKEEPLKKKVKLEGELPKNTNTLAGKLEFLLGNEWIRSKVNRGELKTKFLENLSRLSVEYITDKWYQSQIDRGDTNIHQVCNLTKAQNNFFKNEWVRKQLEQPLKQRLFSFDKATKFKEKELTILATDYIQRWIDNKLIEYKQARNLTPEAWIKLSIPELRQYIDDGYLDVIKASKLTENQINTLCQSGVKEGIYNKSKSIELYLNKQY